MACDKPVVAGPASKNHPQKKDKKSNTGYKCIEHRCRDRQSSRILTTYLAHTQFNKALATPWKYHICFSEIPRDKAKNDAVDVCVASGSTAG